MDALDSYNESRVGTDHYQSYTIAVIDSATGLVGGMVGARSWRIFFVGALYVEASHRRLGIGRDLLAKTELLARSIGCDVVYLDTSEFQAPDFYPKFGYRRFATLAIPQGFRRFWLYKRLDEATIAQTVVEHSGPYRMMVDQDPATTNWIVDQLIAFNESKAGPRNARRYAVLAFNSIGEQIGGLLAERSWKMLFVSHLYVEASRRSQGIGRGLLERAEELAQKVGCTIVFLDTFEFEAPEFYRKCGYQQIGQLDVPAGFRRFWFAKDLVDQDENRT
jgi:GNAT superfamily N-acetyltransferase